MIWDMTVDGGATTLAVWTRSRGAYVWPLPSSPFRTCPDYNGDGTIDVLDIASIAMHWGETTASPGWDNKYDRDGDGDVDIVDIMMVANAFGDSC
ncbi:MAG: dockerin type I domain-containing protein [Caldilineales bacterium]